MSRELRSWRPGRCNHERCDRARIAAVFFALTGGACLAVGTVRTVSLPWLITGAVCLAGWAAAALWPHPGEAQQRDDLEALIEATRPGCGFCLRADDSPCRCREDCGHRECTGWYAELERQMSR